MNVQGRQAKPCSPPGPIYPANTRVQGRTKSGRKGRAVLTMPDRLEFRAAGRGALMVRTRGWKSTRLERYAACKRALGKFGKRDLEFGRQLLGSSGTVRVSNSAATSGFRREGQRRQGLGSETRDEWLRLPVQGRSRGDEAGWGDHAGAQGG